MRDSIHDLYKRERQKSSGFTVLILLAMMVGCGPRLSDEVSHGGATAGASDAAVTYAETGVSQAAPVPSSAQMASEPLAMPTWLARDLASSDVQVKLQALDRWAHAAPVGSVDPLLLALEDADETVQVRVLALLEEDWRRAQEDER